MLPLHTRRRAAPPALLLPLLLGCGTTLLAAPPGAAQVTTSQQALDALGSGQPAPSASRHAPAPHHRAATHPAVAHPPSAHTGKPIRAASAHPPSPTIPPGPPPPPVFRAPLINVPLHPPPPPPPVAVVQTAVGVASPFGDGTRITFGASSADLNPTTMQALHGMADRLKANPSARVDLDAFGSVTEDDPSTPRRLAFERGITARAVLINDGIASTRIYLRVIGAPPPASPDGTPSDRVDMALSSATQGAPSVAPSSSATARPRQPAR